MRSLQYQPAPQASASISLTVHLAFSTASIRLWQDEVRGLMLNRICAFGADPAFYEACVALAADADMTLQEAAAHLYPITREVYEGACHGSD